jgi:molybdenum cofactor guanylyltransferase
MSETVNATPARPADDAGSTLGLILNGGLGRRMGGADKGLIALGRRPMIAHAIERLRPQCRTLAISANGDAARFAAFGLPVIADDSQEPSGPLAGVLAGLEHCARNGGLGFVASLAADTPFAPRNFVERLHAARRAEADEIAVAASGGRTHFVAALWPVEAAPELRRTLLGEGQRRMESVLRRFRVAVVEWPVDPVDAFFNVNTPEDLARAEAILRDR